MDWNVIVSVQEHAYKPAREFLYEYGKASKTDYFNVLVVLINDIEEFMEDLRALFEIQAPQAGWIGRAIPVTHRFVFQSPEEFEIKAREVVAGWLDDLAGRHFYVRMHRRGFKGRLSSRDEEQFLDEYILEQLQERGQAPAKVDFENAERVIAIETVGQEAGMSLWTREELQRYPFLKLD